MPHLRQGPKDWPPWFGVFWEDYTTDRMVAADSGAVAAAHSTSSSVVGVTTLGHSASTSGIAAEESKTRGVASALVSATDSSMGVGRIG
jgi:hypothetical protein